MTPGLVVSNRTTNGSSDNGGIQDLPSLVQCERLSKIQEDGPCASRVPPLPMLQNFLILSIKTQLKTLIMNILCNTYDAARAAGTRRIFRVGGEISFSQIADHRLLIAGRRGIIPRT
jgi:hypothetical protein